MLGDVADFVKVDDLDAELLLSILETEGNSIDADDSLSTLKLTPPCGG
jgi:hypothetical protein